MIHKRNTFHFLLALCLVLSSCEMEDKKTKYSAYPNEKEWPNSTNWKHIKLNFYELKDSSQLYYRAKQEKEFPEIMLRFPNPIDFESVEEYQFYIVDKNSVILKEHFASEIKFHVLENIDPDSFHILGNSPYAIEREAVYFKGNKMNAARETFEIIDCVDYFLAKDAVNYYYEGNIISNDRAESLNCSNR